MNTQRTPEYIKLRNIIRSCRNIPQWQVAFRCLLNYEERHQSEYGLKVELYEKEEQLTTIPQ